MELSRRKLGIISQALSYAILYTPTEHETAEFASLKMDIDSAIIRQDEATKIYSSLPG